ncbi:hypothetical protein [Arenimonas sp.]|uniref:hypothetical protein n=1 Tax=Arenimonas sp. TaxID=1872635 RepID=UPI0039E5B003
MICSTRDTLKLAASRLRSDKACPHTADELDCDVIPVVDMMAEALRYVRDSTGSATAAHQRAAEALAAYDRGMLPPRTDSNPDNRSIPA